MQGRPVDSAKRASAGDSTNREEQACQFSILESRIEGASAARGALRREYVDGMLHRLVLTVVFNGGGHNPSTESHEQQKYSPELDGWGFPNDGDHCAILRKGADNLIGQSARNSNGSDARGEKSEISRVDAMAVAIANERLKVTLVNSSKFEPLDKRANKLTYHLGRVVATDENLCLQEKAFLFERTNDHFIFRRVLSTLCRKERSPAHPARQFARLFSEGNVVKVSDLNPKVIGALKEGVVEQGMNVPLEQHPGH
jgi:hypothetical protein